MINITVDVIGIIGFVLSAINFIYFLIIRRKKLSLNFYIHSIADYFDKKQRLKIFFCIENHSQLPISITRIRLLLNEKYYDCESSPMIVEEWSRKRNGKVYDQDIIKTKSLPFNLNPLMAESGYIGFLIPQGTLSGSEKSLTFQICTSRGKAVQKTFVLHEDVRLR